MAHLLISAAHKSSGKTTISVGLCAALKARGQTVQPFKKGPDYIDPMWLAKACQRDCYNLDYYLMENDEIQSLFSTKAKDAAISIIEGNKGLYDGLDLDGSNSNAALARLLNSPVILTIDARGMTRGIAPLILGYQAFDKKLNIAGVILNQLGGSRHENKLRAVIEHYTDVPVIGAVHHNKDLEITERHLGLIPSNESDAALSKTENIGKVISENVDVDNLIKIASLAGDIEMPPRKPRKSVRTPVIRNVRIGIIHDEAFGFYYPDDLAAFNKTGAVLIELNAVHDKNIPDVDGIFIGGGFPEMKMAELEKNKSFRIKLKNAIENGLPVYAECGGLMYLANNITAGGKTCEMVGVVPGDIIMHEKPQGRGYVCLKETGNGLWPLTNSDSDEINEIYAHEFHYSTLDNIDKDFEFKYAYDVLRGAGIDGKHDGIIYKNLLACYAHQRNVRNNRWVNRFIDFVDQHARSEH